MPKAPGCHPRVLHPPEAPFSTPDGPWFPSQQLSPCWGTRSGPEGLSLVQRHSQQQHRPWGTLHLPVPNAVPRYNGTW